MKMTNRRCALLALVLTCLMALSPSATPTVLRAFAEDGPAYITAFAPLDDGQAVIVAETGMELDVLGLPDALYATVDGADGEVAVASWSSVPEYDLNQAGAYALTPSFDAQAYQLDPGAEPPTFLLTLSGTEQGQEADEARFGEPESEPAGETEWEPTDEQEPEEPLSGQQPEEATDDQAADAPADETVGEPVDVQETAPMDVEEPAQAQPEMPTEDIAPVDIEPAVTDSAPPEPTADVTVFAPNEADPDLNAIVVPDGSLYVNRAFTLEASGDRQDERGMYQGDTRYVPESWHSGSRDGGFGEPTYQAQVRLDRPGDRTITVRFAEQSFTERGWRNTGVMDEKSVQVSIQPVGLTDIRFGRHELILDVGERAKLRFSVEPEGASAKDVWFFSDDEEVATVNADGEVTARTPGETVITAASRDDALVFDECTVTVTEPEDKFLDDEEAYTDDDGVPQTSDPALPMWALGAVMGVGALALIGLLMYYRRRGGK